MVKQKEPDKLEMWLKDAVAKNWRVFFKSVMRYSILLSGYTGQPISGLFHTETSCCIFSSP
jgi:hypothetical protein